MAGGVAHEINNPLGIIKLVTSQIQDLHGEEPFNKALAEEMTSKVIKTTERHRENREWTANFFARRKRGLD